jgi:two-component system, chemotaxis family, chemotaxis protein CheY
MKKILLVDDSGLARRLVRKILEEFEYTIEEATSGPEALEACALNQYDVVILDM